VDKASRKAANEEAVENFFARWDPAWRWILILGLRGLRVDPVALGEMASAEANGHEPWSDDEYAFGPMSLGLTAAAVNECAQHCEDLFALLRFLREPMFFAREMANYQAGKVVQFGRTLGDIDELEASRLFLVPDRKTISAGLAKAPDPTASIEVAEKGRDQLTRMLRQTASFYLAHEHFHVHYKHGLKLPLRPFGVPTDEAIADRKKNVGAPLFLWTNEPIAQMLQRSQGAEPMMMVLGPNQQANLPHLIEDRNLMRIRLIAEVDLDEVVEQSRTVLRLLRLAEANRLALGRIDDGLQTIRLPGDGIWENVEIQLDLPSPLSLQDFAG
jgi:hypothetical protein